MTIERALAKLQAAENTPGDRLPRGGRPGVALGQRSHTPETDGDIQRYENDVMKRNGSPTIGLGVDWQGMPFMHPEIRAHAETAYNHGNVAGNLSIDVSRAGTQAMIATANLQISLTLGNWPTEAYSKSAGTAGLDIPLTLIIVKQYAGPMTIGVTHWAPQDQAPDLSKPGFYEIGVGLLYFSGDSTLTARGYPIIRPAP